MCGSRAGILVEGGADDPCHEVVGTQVLQRTSAGAPDRRTGSGDEDGFGHSGLRSWTGREGVLTLVRPSAPPSTGGRTVVAGTSDGSRRPGARRRTTPPGSRPRRRRGPCRGRTGSASTRPTSRRWKAASSSASSGSRAASSDSSIRVRSSSRSSSQPMKKPVTASIASSSPRAHAVRSAASCSTSSARLFATYWVRASTSALRVRRYAEQLPSGRPARAVDGAMGETPQAVLGDDVEGGRQQQLHAGAERRLGHRSPSAGCDARDYPPT